MSESKFVEREFPNGTTFVKVDGGRVFFVPIETPEHMVSFGTIGHERLLFVPDPVYVGNGFENLGHLMEWVVNRISDELRDVESALAGRR